MEEVDIQVPKSWNIFQKRTLNEIYAFHKFFPSGEDVIISINKKDNKFEVVSSAVSRTTEPSDKVLGIVNNLEEAVKIAKAKCKWWDEFLDSFWKKKSQ